MIKLQYALTEEDHLQLQLYVASTSERIAKKRKRTRVVLPAVYLLLAVVLFLFADKSFAIAFALIAVLWFLFYPKWETRKYRKHYLNFVRENFQNSIGKPTTLELEKDVVRADNHMGNSTFKTTVVTATDEIADSYYLRLDKGMVIAVPKRILGEHAIAFSEWLEEVEQQNNLTRNVDFNWQWK